MAEAVILDTDIGSDIDDAVALAYLLQQPDCELVGVTTVSGEPRARAEMASAMCRHVGRDDVPIRVGTADPLFVEPKQPRAPQAAALADRPRDRDFGDEHAVEWLRRTIRSRPGEITLLPIGPLTNIGLLFALDPEIPSLLKGLVLMGGRFTMPIPNVGLAEWNILCDPHAAAIVYRARPAVHRSVGICVTRQVTLSADEVRQRFTAPVLEPVRDFAEVWFDKVDRITFHDPLAAALVFDDALCGWARGRVEVERESPLAAGLTAWTADADGPHEVAVTVEADRFFAHYFDIVNG